MTLGPRCAVRSVPRAVREIVWLHEVRALKTAPVNATRDCSRRRAE